MTSLTDNTIDELIKRVKASPAMSELVYASEYPPRDLPSIMDKYVVTVSNTGVEVLRQFVGDAVADGRRGALYGCELRLRVYSPSESAGAALLRVTSLLYDAVCRADTDGAVQDMSLSGISYDDTAHTVYRDLTVRLGYVLSEEARHD